MAADIAGHLTKTAPRSSTAAGATFFRVGFGRQFTLAGRVSLAIWGAVVAAVAAAVVALRPAMAFRVRSCDRIGTAALLLEVLQPQTCQPKSEISGGLRSLVALDRS
jgi:hypothetical protein